MPVAPLLASGVFVFGGCIVAKQSLDPPPNDQATVVLLTGTLGHPLDGIARHPWFAVRARGATTWQIYEVGGGGDEVDPFRHHAPYGDPIVHATWRGAEAERAAACLAAKAEPWKSALRYRFYPGPNSNTFGDAMLRACHLHASLPATSVGKDWRGGFGANVTTEGTGVQVETPLVGLRVGFFEGVELHVLGLAIGVDLWPPAIIVPLGPGRIGFADR